MYILKRDQNNPLIAPRHDHAWEYVAAFNPSPVLKNDETHLFYRAMSRPDVLASPYAGRSSIGKAISLDGEHFQQRRQVIIPEYEWEALGCEDPRVTHFEGKYYIFYTAVRDFNADGIKVAVAVSENCEQFDEKHLVTPFNAKAFALFPERVNGKVTAIFSAHTDEPPTKMAIVQADDIEDFWDPTFWETWHKDIDAHTLSLKRFDDDHVEVGAVPVKTEHGWLLIYSHIQKYFNEQQRIFGIEAVLLDINDPTKIVKRTRGPIMVPETIYEYHGLVPNITFPSGAILKDDVLEIFYGGADTTCNRAYLKFSHLIDSMDDGKRNTFVTRAKHNPILEPIKEHDWESKWVFNAAAFDTGEAVHMLYRAMSNDNTSTLGYAKLSDALHVDERLPDPVYVPREDFEKKKRLPNGYSGCEDPRTTVIDDTVYMTYTAYNGVDPTRVALTSIKIDDVKKKNWNWATPQLITPDNVDDKNMCLLPEKIGGKYMLIHRIDRRICADLMDDLDFSDGRVNRCIEIMGPRPGMWDSEKIGITGPPMKIDEGWLLIYHGVSKTKTYRFGAVLLDKDMPTNVIARTVDPIMGPLEEYELKGQVDNVVFSCGVVLRDDTFYIYYGGADTVMAVATLPKQKLLDTLLPHGI